MLGLFHRLSWKNVSVPFLKLPKITIKLPKKPIILAKITIKLAKITIKLPPFSVFRRLTSVNASKSIGKKQNIKSG